MTLALAVESLTNGLVWAFSDPDPLSCLSEEDCVSSVAASLDRGELEETIPPTTSAVEGIALAEEAYFKTRRLQR